MDNKLYIAFKQDGFIGECHKDILPCLKNGRLRSLSQEVATAQDRVLSRGRHKVVVLDFSIGNSTQSAAVKSFGLQQPWKDRYDKNRGSKAARSYIAARFLESHNIQTPRPLAYLERWEKNKLVDAYYLSTYIAELSSFKTKLADIYESRGPCINLVNLLKDVGTAMRAMHNAGFYHKDLGNQNIELLKDPDNKKEKVFFLDLNRSRIRKKLSLKERASDFSRLKIPSAFLEVLTQIYFDSPVPAEFRRELLWHRRKFLLWEKSRKFRHPIKYYYLENKKRSDTTLQMKDVWIWDDRSGQASITLNRKDRKKNQAWVNHLKIGLVNLMAIPSVWWNYRRNMSNIFQTRIHMADRIGISLEAADLEFEPQLATLKELNIIPVLLRIGHHQGKVKWDESISHIHQLSTEGKTITVTIFQDRHAVIEPELWLNFLEYVLEKIASKIDSLIVGHTLNRVKWGIHSIDEYTKLIEPLVSMKERYPNLKILGPNCIDFEPHYPIAALKNLPKGLRFNALSHLLYVDRRGAPENKQGCFGIVEKAALLNAVASHSGSCESKLVISEVNWPLANTREWSPVAATYSPPDSAASHLHVTEEQYGYFMVRYLALTICSGLVERVYWWRLVSHGFGLVDELAEGGWRKRAGYYMLKTFLLELGNATFVEKIATPKEVYALRFEREDDDVVLLWCNGRKYSGPWPITCVRALNSTGNEIKLSEVGDDPVYLLSPRH